jgi:predicted acyl esterase
MNDAAIVEDVSDRVRSIELVWIPMADGRRLAARIWLPLDAESRNAGLFSTPVGLPFSQRSHQRVHSCRNPIAGPGTPRWG